MVRSFFATAAFLIASPASAQELPPPLPATEPAPLEQVAEIAPEQAERTAIEDAVALAENFGTDLPLLVDAVADATTLAVQPEELKARAESEILRYVRPLPGAQIEDNLAAYAALAALRPASSEYSAKRDAYKAKLDERRRAILTRYKTRTDEFNGVTFYKHKAQPRYTDTRPYVSMYIGKAGDRAPALHFVLNYTTRNGWLFVQRALANIDGDIVSIPGTDWKRDNDSETWEWIDEIATPPYVLIAKRIANSKKTVIRFEGQDYYDNYVVRPEDKEVLRDALIAFEVLGGTLP